MEHCFSFVFPLDFSTFSLLVTSIRLQCLAADEQAGKQAQRRAVHHQAVTTENASLQMRLGAASSLALMYTDGIRCIFVELRIRAVHFPVTAARGRKSKFGDCPPFPSIQAARRPLAFCDCRCIVCDHVFKLRVPADSVRRRCRRPSNPYIPQVLHPS